MLRTALASLLILLCPGGTLVAFDRPESGGVSYAEQIGMELSQQRRSVGSVSQQDRNTRLISEVLDRYRMLVEALLNRGARLQGDTGARMIVYATRMMDAEPSIVHMLDAFASNELSDQNEASVRTELVRFKQGIRAGLARIPTRHVPNPEHAVMDLMQPLRSACEIASSQAGESGWWPEATRPRQGSYSKQRDLESAFLEIEVDESLRALLAEMPRDSRLFRSSVSLIVDLDAHSWMNGPSRKAIKATLQAEIEQAALSAEHMRESAERIEAMNEMVVSLAQLAEAPGGRAVATRRSKTFEDLLEIWPGQFVPAPTAHSIAQTIEVLARTRSVEDEGLSRFRTRVHAGLMRQRLLAETRAFDSFSDVARSEEPWTEPGLVVILSEPRHLLVAMQRLHQLESWSQSIHRMAPDHAPALVDRLEVLVGAMADVRTREDASRALSEFERQLDLFEVIDGESRMVGGRFDPEHRLAEYLDDARSRWVMQWSNDRSAGDASDDLYLYSRLLDHVQCLYQLKDGGLEQANDLPAWSLPVELIEYECDRFEESIDELAAEMLGSGRLSPDDRAHIWRLHSDLEQAFATLRLIALVSSRSPRRQADEQHHVRLASLTTPASATSAFRLSQPHLARISHGLLDASVLIQQERTDDADVLMDWINEQSRRLLSRLASTPARPLAVPGMRAGDGEIDPGRMEMMR